LGFVPNDNSARGEACGGANFGLGAIGGVPEEGKISTLRSEREGWRTRLRRAKGGAPGRKIS